MHWNTAAWKGARTLYHCEQNPIPTGLRHAALGKLVEEYLSALPPERLQAEAHTQAEEAPVSYTHLTLPTIYSV